MADSKKVGFCRKHVYILLKVNLIGIVDLPINLKLFQEKNHTKTASYRESKSAVCSFGFAFHMLETGTSAAPMLTFIHCAYLHRINSHISQTIISSNVQF